MTLEETATMTEEPETESHGWRDALGDTFYRKIREARDRLDSTLHDLGDKATATGQQVKHGVELTEDRIKETPWAAVGIAAGVGLVLGLLINRNR